MQNTPSLPNETPTIRELLAVWLRIGLLSFGGPAGQIALMHRIVVEEKGWLDEPRFLRALNFCMLLPGPEAQQLATYIGWQTNRTLGGAIAGVLFVLPGALVILALSLLYALHADLTFVAGIFFGLKAAVIAIVIQALIKISKKALKGPQAIWIAVFAFIAIFLFAVPFPLIIAAAGLFGFLQARSRSSSTPADMPDNHDQKSSFRPALTSLALWLIPVASLILLLGPDNVFSQIAVFFSKLAVVTFGGAYAVLSYMTQETVQTYGWLTPYEMVDGLGLAETTPGPLILVTEFVGFLGAYRGETGLDPVTAGILGAILTVWVTFAPCFFWIFIGAPFIERLEHAPSIAAALSAITAAVVGVVANLTLWFSVHVLFAEVRQVNAGPVETTLPGLASIDLIAVGLAAASALLLFRFRMNMILVLALAGAAGVALT